VCSSPYPTCRHKPLPHLSRLACRLGAADKFYKAKAYQAAVNAYGTVLQKDGRNAACLSNRASCYLRVGEML